MNGFEIAGKIMGLISQFPVERLVTKPDYTKSEKLLEELRARTAAITVSPPMPSIEETADQASPPASSQTSAPEYSLEEIIEREREGDWCVSCMPPQSLVIGYCKAKPICEFAEGDLALGYTDDNKITKTFSREYNGDIFKISTAYCSIPAILTPEHPVLVIDARQCSHLCRSLCLPGHEYRGCNNTKVTYRGSHKTVRCLGQFYKDYKPYFTEAKNLHKGQVTLLPIEKKTIDVDTIKISDIISIPVKEENGYITKVNKQNHKGISVRNAVKIDKNFMGLAGYYLAEGYPTFGERGGQIHLAFGKTERSYAEETVDFFYGCFGVDAHIIEREFTLNVEVYSEILAHFFTELFGKGAVNKHVPEWVIYLPIEKQSCLIERYKYGDGCDTETGYEFFSVSPTLIFQIRAMLMRQGIIAGLRLRKNPKGGTVNGREIKSNYDGYRLCVCTSTIRKAHAGIDKNWMYLPILKIEREHYEGEVNNLEVTPENVYMLPNMTVHNCIPAKHLMRVKDSLLDALNIARTKGEFTDVAEKKIQNAVFHLNGAEEDLMHAAIPGDIKPATDAMHTQTRALRNFLRQDTSGLELATMIPKEEFDKAKGNLEAAFDVTDEMIKKGYELAKLEMKVRREASI